MLALIIDQPMGREVERRTVYPEVPLEAEPAAVPEQRAGADDVEPTEEETTKA